MKIGTLQREDEVRGWPYETLTNADNHREGAGNADGVCET
eukprot:CAMPEP_0202848656 /NCGR_PEP_ID=MMETSP1389-20130828/78670_1 /ASSEMBLY_ACC=CAM_ASM_000865 /TAXON_ID=302021 /ORGANISM="Rhodomonas sp., Strain CCMP768" /LENGTH=39 /DNA_ID= /DNA_START= /DNA_END= /DNA_ORIENTATION=